MEREKRVGAAFDNPASKFATSRRALERRSRYIATAPLDHPPEPEMTITIEYCTV
jgi:hypothetical protein